LELQVQNHIKSRARFHNTDQHNYSNMPHAITDGKPNMDGSNLRRPMGI